MAGSLDILTNVFDTLDMIMEWLIDSLTNCTRIFMGDNGGLTVLGVFALMGLGVSIALLVVNIIKNFVQFR